MADRGSPQALRRQAGLRYSRTGAHPAQARHPRRRRSGGSQESDRRDSRIDRSGRAAGNVTPIPISPGRVMKSYSVQLRRPLQGSSERSSGFAKSRLFADARSSNAAFLMSSITVKPPDVTGGIFDHRAETEGHAIRTINSRGP